MRNVRPSWIKVAKSDSGNDTKPFYKGTGPRGRSGSLSAEFLARIKGDAVPFLRVDAIASADGETVFWTVTEIQSGRIVFETRVTQ